MPFYEYVCPRCGHEFEQLQKFSDAPLTNCPACHEDGLQKKISAPAFHLKGSGWYVTDFRDGPKSKETTDKKAEAKTSESDKASADTNTTKISDKPSTETTSVPKSESETATKTD